MNFMKRKMKQIGAMLLALVLLAAVPLSALATAVDPDADVSLTIYKYKDAEGAGIDGDGTYQNISGFDPIVGVTFSVQQVTFTDGVGDGDVNNPLNYTATSASAVTGTTDSTGKIVFSTDSTKVYGSSGVLPGQGTYLVTETSGPGSAMTQFLVSLPMVDPNDSAEWLYDVYVYPKNEMAIDIDKEYVEPDDSLGTDDNILVWTIDVKIPTGIVNSAGDAWAQNFVLTDTITPADIDFVVGSLVGTVTTRDGSTVTLTATDDYTYTLTGNVLEIKLTTAGIKKLADAYAATSGTTAVTPTLTFTYATTVSMTNPDDLGAVKNTVELDYTSASGYVYDTIKDDADAVLYGIKITKTDIAGNLLDGAKFQIYTDEATAKAAVGLGTTTTALKDSDDTVLEVTTVDGIANIYGLEPGVYYLVETVAPDGYNLLTAPITVTVNDTTADVSTYIVDVSVVNSSTFMLPQTGGTGAIMFTVAGLVLIAAAGVFLIVAKKKGQKDA